MAKERMLKEAHPQKYCLKLLCTAIYCLGGGNCWYQERKVSKPLSFIYNIYSVAINIYALVVFIDQLLSHCRPLTVKEQNDVVQFDIAHSTICAKFIVLYLQKKRIKVHLERFLEDDREFASLELEKQSVRKAVRYCAAMQICVYFTLLTYLLDGVRIHFQEGIPIRAEVVLYPSPSHSGLLINILRVFVELHWWYIITMMACIDGVSVCSMVFLAYKFKSLAVYFERLGQRFKNNEGKKSLQAEYRKDFITGIELHKHVLWYSQHIQHSLGNLYSIQVIETMFLITMALIKLVVVERSFTFLVASVTYMAACAMLLGGYMMAAGDITYEASLLPNAIFNAGWELTRGNKELRRLTVVALISSQRPVYMTAFGVLQLSYSNLIMVLRSSYSFFAVMY